MNERIKELAKQAGGNPNYKAFRGYFLPPPPDYIDPATVNLEKFAELIVRECANIAADMSALDIYEEIREHFGVEQ
jgi:hypothetical protein